MKSKVSIGVVGLGKRGFLAGEMHSGLISILAAMDDIEIVAVCDEYEDRVDMAVKVLGERYGFNVAGSTDYMDVINNPKVDAVAIFSAWESHVPVAIAAMKARKAVAMEVGGAYSVEDCWNLVRTQEETGAYFMMLENCCYDRAELLLLNMVRKGLLGEIVHCAGGYHHDLRHEVSGGEVNRHYRLRNYILRDCDNYPTHELGPIAKILNINNGNRMLSLVSMSSKAAGLNEYNKREKGEEYELSKLKFAQGDIVTTIIKCAGGETITLTLDTTLPRPYYSRGFTIRGTKGAYIDETKSVYIEGDSDEPEGSSAYLNNIDEYYKKYNSPIWEEYDALGIEAGHGGIDWHVLRAFVESYKEGIKPPVDVYDAAAWMSVSALSEISISKGSVSVDIPDFTSGKWIKPEPKKEWKYSL